MAKQKELKVVDRRSFTPEGDKKPVQKPVAPKVSAVPVGSKLLVWRIPEEKGLIEMADVGKEKPLECEVLAVSATGLNEYDSKALALFQPGDKVLIRRNTGTEIKVEGHDLTILHVQDVLLKL